MRRLAIFVEGHTEVLFISALLEEVAEKHSVVFEVRKILGGARTPRRNVVLQAAKVAGTERYYVLIVDCGGDKLVKQRISEEHQSLTNKGYEKIIGVRDVAPDYSIDTLSALERSLPLYIRTSLAAVEFVLAVHEIEAWFLAEHTHLGRIEPRITNAAVKASLGFDPAVDDMQLRPAPAVDLDTCYQLGGKRYTKAGEGTIHALDFAAVYTEVQARFRYLQKLCDSIDAFLT